MPDTATPPATATTVEPGNNNPAHDAHGVPVISAPATAPAGANEPPAPGVAAVPSPNQVMVFAAQPATTAYPPCSKTVTDHCVQTYDRKRR